MNIRLDIEYLGTNYSGWQVQPGMNTIQSHLESKLIILINSELKKSNLNLLNNIRITASGRTDAGVHAKNQVVSFNWPGNVSFPEKTFLRSINGLTNNDVSIKSYEEVNEDFDARFSATSKEYCYTILNRKVSSPFYKDTAWHIIKELDLKKIEEGLQLFRGIHDFKCFRASDCTAKTTTRTIYNIKVIKKNEIIKIYIIGNGFLKNMIRFIVGALVEISNYQSRDISYIKELLNGNFNIRDPIKIAPPHGLCLTRVGYGSNVLSI